MKRKFDTVTLSSYLDGELDVRSICQVSDFVAGDEDARRFALDAIRTDALLRATARSRQDRESMERIMKSPVLARKALPEGKRKPMDFFTRIAAGFVVALLGFGAGSMVDLEKSMPTEKLIPQLPSSYRQVVDNTLENEVSGVTRQWISPVSHSTVEVTPIGTYRDSQNRYYRKYKLVVISETSRSQIIGLALRDAKKSWKTKSLTFVDDPGRV